MGTLLLVWICASGDVGCSVANAISAPMVRKMSTVDECEGEMKIGLRVYLEHDRTWAHICLPAQFN